MRRLKHIPAFVLTLALVIGVFAFTAIADNSTQVPTADTLSVYMMDMSQQSVLLHEYTPSELQALSRGTDIFYSSIDAMPTAVLTVATGVYISDLISDAEKYAGSSLSNFKYFMMNAPDGWSRHYEKSELFQTRYYYPGLFQTELTDGKAVPSLVGSGTPVEPMLAVVSWQDRVPLNHSMISNAGSVAQSDYERFRFCIGQLESDLTSGNSTTANYGRGVNEVYIIMDKLSAPNISVTGLTITTPEGAQATIEVGKTVQVTAKVIPDDATNKGITWKSSNTAVATVTNNGLVKGISAGFATITAAADGNAQFSKTCNITVTAPAKVEVTGVTLNRSTASVVKGGTLSLSAIVAPSNAANKNVSWSSSASGVATVNSSGVVIGVSAGTAVITAKTEDGSFTASCTVTVSLSAVKVTGVTLDCGEMTVKKGYTQLLTATVSPAGATNDAVYWSSSVPGVASVDTNGNVTGTAEGETVVTVETEDGGFTASCKITVTLNDIKVTGVTLSPKEVKIQTGESLKITAAVSPSGATNKRLTWSSSIPQTARIDENGNVIGISEGVCVITAVTEDGRFSDSCIVTVTATGQNVARVSFPDCEDHWAKDSIERLAGMGVIAGYTDGSFHPADDVTRGEFLKILISAMEVMGKAEITSGAGFSDTEGHWAANYISTAAAMGIVNGFGDNTFAPDAKITREQIAVILAKAAGLKPTGSLADFSDADSIAPWARDSVIAVSEAGLFTGSDGRFDPVRNASRAEAAVLVIRFFDNYGGAKQ